MLQYKNLMELLVEEQFERMLSQLGCCTCEQCQTDIVALALNKLPPKYVSNHKGELYSRLALLRQQRSADIVVAITAAANVVGQNPRHEKAEGAKP